MDLKKIKALLADYYEGKTSREEEELLADFFKKRKVPPEMEADRLLFISLDEAAREDIPDKQFDDKLFDVIEELDNKKEPAGIRKIIYTVSGIAASLLLILGSYLFFIEDQINEIAWISEEYTEQETRLAYEEAKNALLMVSYVMNTGTEELEPLSKISEATRELEAIGKFHRGARELGVITKFDKTVTGLQK